MFSYGFFPNFMQFKLHISSKFEYGASFDIPGVPGGVSIVKVQEFRDLFWLFCDGCAALVDFFCVMSA